MNATAPIIVMLDYSEIDMKTTKSDDCREMSGDDRNFNRILATIQDRVRFSCKDGQKFINPFIQSISRLYHVSQLYLRTKEQEKSSKVT